VGAGVIRLVEANADLIARRAGRPIRFPPSARAIAARIAAWIFPLRGKMT
jgi:hypothetical protein